MKKCVWTVAMVLAVAAMTGCKDKVKAGEGRAAAIGADDAGGLSEHQQMTFDAPPASVIDPAKVVARIGTNEIRQAEVEKIVAAQLAQYGGQVPEQFQAQMRAQMQPRIVEMLVAQHVLRAEVAARGITVDDADVEQRLAQMAATLPEGVSLEEALAQRSMTKDELVRNVKEGLVFEKLIDAETADKVVAPTEAAALAFYEEHKAEQFTSEETARASHILITPETEDDAGWAKAKEKVDALSKQLQDGADFAELAKEHSSCPSKEKGGDLGEFGHGKMVPEFDEAAFSQELNVVGLPIKTQFGYHLVKVMEKNPAVEKPFAEVKDDILESLAGQAKAAPAEAFIDGLKAKADVEIME